MAVGEDKISGEHLMAGVDSLAEKILHLINTYWFTKTVPQNLKNVKITTFYKNKSVRGDCNSCRRISLLSDTGKAPVKGLLNRLPQLV